MIQGGDWTVYGRIMLEYEHFAYMYYMSMVACCILGNSPSFVLTGMDWMLSR